MCERVKTKKYVILLFRFFRSNIYFQWACVSVKWPTHKSWINYNYNFCNGSHAIPLQRGFHFTKIIIPVVYLDQRLGAAHSKHEVTFSQDGECCCWKWQIVWGWWKCLYFACQYLKLILGIDKKYETLSIYAIVPWQLNVIVNLAFPAMLSLLVIAVACIRFENLYICVGQLAAQMACVINGIAVSVLQI